MKSNFWLRVKTDWIVGLNSSEYPWFWTWSSGFTPELAFGPAQRPSGYFTGKAMGDVESTWYQRFPEETPG